MANRLTLHSATRDTAPAISTASNERCSFFRLCALFTPLVFTAEVLISTPLVSSSSKKATCLRLALAAAAAARLAADAARSRSPAAPKAPRKRNLRCVSVSEPLSLSSAPSETDPRRIASLAFCTSLAATPSAALATRASSARSLATCSASCSSWSSLVFFVDVSVDSPTDLPKPSRVSRAEFADRAAPSTAKSASSSFSTASFVALAAMASVRLCTVPSPTKWPSSSASANASMFSSGFVFQFPTVATAVFETPLLDSGCAGDVVSVDADEEEVHEALPLVSLASRVSPSPLVSLARLVSFVNTLFTVSRNHGGRGTRSSTDSTMFAVDVKSRESSWATASSSSSGSGSDSESESPSAHFFVHSIPLDHQSFPPVPSSVVSSRAPSLHVFSWVVAASGVPFEAAVTATAPLVLGSLIARTHGSERPRARRTRRLDRKKEKSA